MVEFEVAKYVGKSQWLSGVLRPSTSADLVHTRKLSLAKLICEAGAARWMKSTPKYFEENRKWRKFKQRKGKRFKFVPTGTTLMHARKFRARSQPSKFIGTQKCFRPSAVSQIWHHSLDKNKQHVRTSFIWFHPSHLQWFIATCELWPISPSIHQETAPLCNCKRFQYFLWPAISQTAES